MQENMMAALRISKEVKDQIVVEVTDAFRSSISQEAAVAAALVTIEQGTPLRGLHPLDREIVEQIFDMFGIDVPT